MLVRHPALFSDARRYVPFAKESVCVTRLLQALGDRDMLRPNRRNHVRRLRPVVFRRKFSRKVRGHAEPGWSLPREHSGPCGRTNRCRRISIGEPHPLLGQAVEMRCLHKLVALTGKVHPAEVIGHHKQNIGPLGLRCSSLAKREKHDRSQSKSDRSKKDHAGRRVRLPHRAFNITLPALHGPRYGSKGRSDRCPLFFTGYSQRFFPAHSPGGVPGQRRVAGANRSFLSGPLRAMDAEVSLDDSRRSLSL